MCGSRLPAAARISPRRKIHRSAVTIPPTLRKWAGLDRELVVIGAGSRAEIWDAEAWNAYVSENEDDFANTAEEVIPGLF